MTDPTRGQIHFDQMGIGSVLKQFRLIVPPYQREYSWRTNEVKKLLQDFAKAISEDAPEYFLGQVVTIPKAVDVLEVVDGQQRLATTAILLAEIRNYLLDKEPILVDSLQNGFLTHIDREKRERTPKLQLNVDDNEVFRACITAKPGELPQVDKRSSHELIVNAFEKAREQVKGIVSTQELKDHGDVLNKWINFVEHRAQVILLQVPSSANAYKMFETLNDRGLRTSQADLIKSYLFQRAGEDRLPEAQHKWTRMRSSLESLEEEEVVVTFLRHSLIVMAGYLTAADVFDAVQRRVKGPQAAIEFLTAIERLAAIYYAILNSESEKWNTYPDSMRRAVQTLDRLNLKVLRPLMLAVATRFEPNEAAEAFQTFISWGVRLLVASSTRSESIIEPIASAAHDVFEGKIKNLKELKKALREQIPVDEQFRQAFETSTVSKAALARYYLRSLEMVAKHEATPWFIPLDDRQVINLEHVLPERPEKNWPSFDEDKVRTYSKRIGNMALLLARSNSDLRSASFDEKKNVYKETPYVLTSQIATVSEWDEKQIALRQRGLADLALQAWPL